MCIRDRPEDKLLLWLSRPSGTFCFRERDVLLKDTQAYNTWKFCGEQTHDRILALSLIHISSTIKQPTYYDVPPEALKDDKFAAMMEEATKYIGYPYVWGGSSPSTSFDCSGYISWVLNHSGWKVGRQTAQGLYNLCAPVSTAQVKPGDLVFFKGTYDTPGVSHCGVYVGNSIMLHCGDPISYTNLNSKYWQEHFYSYGRLP